MKAFRTLIGVKDWDIKSTGDHVGMSENKHKLLDDVLDQTWNKGDVTDAASLEFYVKAAQTRNNMLVSTDGSTPFEKLTAEICRTMVDLTKMPDESEVKTLAVPDASFISQMADYVNETLAWCQAKAAERVAHHMASLYNASDRKRQTHFHMCLI